MEVHGESSRGDLTSGRRDALLFSGVHLSSGDPHHGQLVYWLVVALIAAFIAWGRLGPRPL